MSRNVHFQPCFTLQQLQDNELHTCSQLLWPYSSFSRLTEHQTFGVRETGQAHLLKYFALRVKSTIDSV